MLKFLLQFMVTHVKYFMLQQEYLWTPTNVSFFVHVLQPLFFIF
uniref:Uncharacterized protein n=1 Tax=Rhizophora mucronata TaxID=61149 RepID=A0A2P2QPR7_RHIMU